MHATDETVTERQGQPLLEAVGLTKRFNEVTANDQIDFDLRPGEIHALLGENGSGKTTLLSVLYGLIHPDEGTIAVRGEPIKWSHRHQPRQHGIGMVPQRFLLVPTLSVAENIALSAHGRGRYRAFIQGVAERVDEIQERYGLTLDPTVLVSELSVGERQRVEIIRALYFDPSVLLLDEPTSVLTPNEAMALYTALQRLVREEGRSIVLTTHRIGEVFEVADRVTVLRGGRKVASFQAAELSRDELVRAMVGERTLHLVHSTELTPNARALLRVRDVTLTPEAARSAGVPPIRSVSFHVDAGEVLGIAGVEGNGQLTLEMLLAGVLQPSSGAIELADGATLERRQIGYIPSDRDRFGVVPSLSVRENLLLRELAEGQLFSRAPIVLSEDGRIERLMAEFQIEPAVPDLRLQKLSGGNAQKVVLARELSRGPLVTIAAQPTAGLDVAAASLVRSRLHDQSRLDRCVLVISSDLDELLELCDRITVMYGGRLLGSWVRRHFDRQAIGAAMAGVEGV